MMRIARSRAITLATSLGVALAAGGTAACGDVAGIEAAQINLHDTLTVFPLTGASAVTPTALNTPFATVTPVGPSGNFDVAFDLDAQRRVVIYPVSMIVQPLTGVNEVRLLKAPGTYAALERAPTGTYELDSITVNVGEVVVIEAKRNRSSDICSFALSPNIYSKLVVDSVSAGTNAIWIRVAANPNCGFRSFATGFPKD
jgi:hypothetical protein